MYTMRRGSDIDFLEGVWAARFDFAFATKKAKLAVMTDEQCDKFHNNPLVNPTTGRVIKERGPKHNELLRMCGQAAAGASPTARLGPAPAPGSTAPHTPPCLRDRKCTPDTIAEELRAVDMNSDAGKRVMLLIIESCQCIETEDGDKEALKRWKDRWNQITDEGDGRLCGKPSDDVDADDQVRELYKLFALARAGAEIAAADRSAVAIPATTSDGEGKGEGEGEEKGQGQGPSSRVSRVAAAAMKFAKNLLSGLVSTSASLATTVATNPMVRVAFLIGAVLVWNLGLKESLTLLNDAYEFARFNISGGASLLSTLASPLSSQSERAKAVYDLQADNAKFGIKMPSTLISLLDAWTSGDPEQRSIVEKAFHMLGEAAENMESATETASAAVAAQDHAAKMEANSVLALMFGVQCTGVTISGLATAGVAPLITGPLAYFVAVPATIVTVIGSLTVTLKSYMDSMVTATTYARLAAPVGAKLARTAAPADKASTWAGPAAAIGKYFLPTSGMLSYVPTIGGAARGVFDVLVARE